MPNGDQNRYENGVGKVFKKTKANDAGKTANECNKKNKFAPVAGGSMAGTGRGFASLESWNGLVQDTRPKDACGRSFGLARRI